MFLHHLKMGVIRSLKVEGWGGGGGEGRELRWKLMVRKNITLAWPGVTNDKKVEAGLGNKALVVSSMYFQGEGENRSRESWPHVETKSLRNISIVLAVNLFISTWLAAGQSTFP